MNGIFLGHTLFNSNDGDDFVRLCSYERTYVHWTVGSCAVLGCHDFCASEFSRLDYSLTFHLFTS